MQTNLLKGVLKESVTIQVNNETVYIPDGNDIIMLVVYSAKQSVQADGDYPCDCVVDYGIDDAGKCEMCGGTPRR